MLILPVSFRKFEQKKWKSRRNFLCLFLVCLGWFEQLVSTVIVIHTSLSRVMGGTDILTLCFLLCPCTLAITTFIDPQNLGSNPVFTHCLQTKDDIILISDPFITSAFDDNLISMDWYLTRNGTEVSLLWFMKSDAKKSDPPKYFLNQFWGMRIEQVSLSDSGTYSARLASLGDTGRHDFQVDVVIPPTLTSDQLTLIQEVNTMDNTVTLSCGQVNSLGHPPISILIKAENGTLLPTVYSDGFFWSKISQKEAGSGKFKCELNSSEPAIKCIDKKDMPRWEGAKSGTSETTPAGSALIGIIAGVAAGAVAIIIVIIIIFIVWKKKKAKKYNAKGQPNDRENDLNDNKSSPLLRDDNFYETPVVNKAPIYKGPKSPGPYMVSSLSKDNAHYNTHDPDEEYEEMNMYNDRSSAHPDFSSYSKKPDIKSKTKPAAGGKNESNRGRDGINEKNKSENPPRAKPRSIFLTPSMEELDKISRAVAGGEGSGAGPIGTQV